MKIKTKNSQFDLRPIDYDTGKRLSIPSSEKVRCDCCGRKLVKGIILTSGEKIGPGCETIRQMIVDGRTKPTPAFGITQKHLDFFTI